MDSADSIRPGKSLLAGQTQEDAAYKSDSNAICAEIVSDDSERI
jgi:hypothetical protein